MYKRLKFLCAAAYEWRSLSRLSYFQYFKASHSAVMTRGPHPGSLHPRPTNKQIEAIFSHHLRLPPVTCLHLLIVRYHSVDSASVEPASCQSVSDLFELIDTYSTKEISRPKDLVECCSCLHSLVYEQELAKIPWILTHDLHIAHLQIVINEQVDNLLSPFFNHSSFNKLVTMIDRHIDDMDSDDICTLFSTLQMLGVPEEDPLIYKIFVKLCDKSLHLTLNNLALISETLRNFRRNDIAIALIVAPRIEALFRNDDLYFGNKNALYDLCSVFIRIKGFVSQEINTEAVDRISVLAFMEDSLQDPVVIASCMRFVRHILSPFAISNLSDETLSKLFDVLDLCVEKFDEQIATCQPKHFARLCSNMKRLGVFGRDLTDKVHNRCLELLDKPLTVAELSCIMHGIKKRMPLEIRRNVEELVLRHIHDADVFILSDLASTLKNINCHNIELVSAYEQAVLANIDKLSQYITLFHKVLYFLVQNVTRYQPFHSQFHSELLRLLTTQQGITVWSICSLSMYLLPSCTLSVPHILMSKLQAIIPQCEMRNMLKILEGLNLVRRPLQHQIQTQLLELHTLIYRHAGPKLQNIDTVFVLCRVINDFYLKSPIKEPTVLNQLMNQLPKFTKELTFGKFNRVILILSQMFYYHPEVYEDLILYALTNVSHLDMFRFKHLLYIISRVGYLPRHMEEFTMICIDMMEKSFDDLHIMAQLNFVYNMCILQIFPDDWLKKIFTFEYLEKVDKFIADSPDVGNSVTMLMMLNRCVVLECPHLDVPWFHEDFCKDQLGTERIVKNIELKTMIKQVGMVLIDVLDGEAFFGRSVYSAYFHLLPFECLLDSKNNPVSYVTGTIVRPEDMGYQRVAILVHTENAFCVDSKLLRGYELMKKRHLEIMGYKVVEVPYFDWQLMALTDWTAKVDYLQKKIFS